MTLITQKDLTEFDTEIVQVGAVASVIIEDMTRGETNGNYTMDALGLMRLERIQQILKWGEQHQTPAVWMAILMEEVGEAADELDVAEIKKDNGDPDPTLQWLIQDIGALGARCKTYLEREFGM